MKEWRVDAVMMVTPNQIMMRFCHLVATADRVSDVTLPAIGVARLSGFVISVDEAMINAISYWIGDDVVVRVVLSFFS